jgi:hypothetical protein
MLIAWISDGGASRCGPGFCCAVFLSACSSTTFFYNRLDIILPWYLERYVDLDREQSRSLTGSSRACLTGTAARSSSAM